MKPVKFWTPETFEVSFHRYHPHTDKEVDGLHLGPATNLKYSKNLYNFLLKNYPQYLPKECGKLKTTNLYRTLI